MTQPRNSKSITISLLIAAVTIFAGIDSAMAQELPDDEQAALTLISTEKDPEACCNLAEQYLAKFPNSEYMSAVFRFALMAAAEIDPHSPRVEETAERYMELIRERYQSDKDFQAHYSAAFWLFRTSTRPAITEEYAKRALSFLTEDLVNRAGSFKYSLLPIVAFYADIRGEYEDAVRLQKEALAMLEDHVQSSTGALEYFYIMLAEYRGSLGQYLLHNKSPEEAAPYLGWATIFDPGNDEYRSALDELAGIITASAGNPHEYKERLIAAIADTVLQNSPNPAETKLTLAKSFANLEVLTERAYTYADDLLRGNTPEAGIGQYLSAHVAKAEVLLAINDYESALSTLSSVEHLATPYDSDFYLSKGLILEQLGRESDAIEAYLEVSGIRDDENINERLIPLWERVYGSSRVLADICAEKAQAAEQWHPEGQYTVPDGWEGRVVLAELFTGADCTPCLAADFAYDHIMEYYPSTVLAVLEYHHHIPLPDPMANPDTDERWYYYEPDIGTPSSRINGRSFNEGGGAPGIAKDLFEIYSWTIERELLQSPPVHLNLNGVRTDGLISFEAIVERQEGPADPMKAMRLRLALVEEEVHYTGMNELDIHKMVVRAFIGGPDGYPIDFNNSRTVISGTYDISRLETEITEYLKEYEENPELLGQSVPRLKVLIKDFYTRIEGIDESQLILVAFVQDDETKEVLQAKVIELK